MLLSSPASVSEIILRSVPCCSIEDLALLSVMLITAPASVLSNVAQVLVVPEFMCNLPVGLVVPIPTFLLVSTASATPPFCIKLNPTLVNVPTEDAPPVLPKYI